MHMPPGTLYPKGDAICSNVKGAFFNPCFNLNKTSDRSFRGAVSGFGFAYCDFVAAAAARETIQASVAPDISSAIARSRSGAAASRPRPSRRKRSRAEAKPAEQDRESSRSRRRRSR